MCGCNKTKYADNSLAKLIDKMQTEFNKAYDEKRSEGFPEGQIIVEGTDWRVTALLGSVRAQYGTVPVLDSDFRLITAVQLLTSLNEAISGLEALRNLSPEAEKEENNSLGPTGAGLMRAAAEEYRAAFAAA